MHHPYVLLIIGNEVGVGGYRREREVEEKKKAG
jgi:hypothetical protein